jgi:hypothetical protein
MTEALHDDGISSGTPPKRSLPIWSRLLHRLLGRLSYKRDTHLRLLK